LGRNFEEWVEISVIYWGEAELKRQMKLGGIMNYDE
jgi:hypothetical protein